MNFGQGKLKHTLTLALPTRFKADDLSEFIAAVPGHAEVRVEYSRADPRDQRESDSCRIVASWEAE